jgi:hypothetical protein
MIWINVLFALVFFAMLTTSDYTGRRWQYILDGLLFSFNIAVIMTFVTS